VIDRVVVAWFFLGMKFLHLLSIGLIVFIIGCASAGRKLDPQAVNSLKEGMTISQVEKLIGPPEHISTAEGGKTYYMYFHGSAGGAFGYVKGKSHRLNLTFTHSRLTHIDKAITHQSGFMSVKTDKVEAGKYSDSDRVPQKAISPEPTKINPAYSNSYEDKKNQLLDMYLQKEITKEEYFELRRELDKTK
jgi:outer membrane protein assembly factor BamE (lipoprotein component of BamABCDE complex)